MENCRESRVEDRYDNSKSFGNLTSNIRKEDIYEYSFYKMYKRVKTTQETEGDRFNVFLNIQRPILQLVDIDTKKYDYIGNMCRHTLLVETENLIMNLFLFYKIEFKETGNLEKYHYIPFYRIEDGKKILYVFSYSIVKKIEWQHLLREYNADGIKVVGLVEVGEDLETLDLIIRFNTTKSGNKLQYITLQDLFSLMPNDEYSVYKKYVELFNKDVEKLLGYKTIIIPSEAEVLKMKEIHINYLRKFDFRACTSEIDENQFGILTDNFWNRGLFEALIGKGSFAESFISSEWYYRTHIASSVLEQTAIIAGYLKSIEQLLYTVVSFSIDTGKTIRRNGGGRREYIYYSTENLDLIDTTLGSVIGYVKHFSDLWNVNPFVKNYITDRLNNYKSAYRNNHLHKDNIKSIDEIKKIRDETILLHFLILGGLKISEENKKRLGIISIPADESSLLPDPSYRSLEQWLDRILRGDMLLDRNIPIFFQTEMWEDDKFKIEFMTVSGFDTYGFPEDASIPYAGDEILWNLTVDREDLFNNVVEWFKRYLAEGKYSRILKTHSCITVGVTGPKHHNITLFTLKD